MRLWMFWGVADDVERPFFASLSVFKVRIVVFVLLGALPLLLERWQVCWGETSPLLSGDKRAVSAGGGGGHHQWAVSLLPCSELLLDSFLPYIPTHPEQLFTANWGTERWACVKAQGWRISLNNLCSFVTCGHCSKDKDNEIYYQK